MLQRKEKQGFHVIPETRENHESGTEFQVKKRMISAVLAMIVFVSALSVPSFAYSRANAINYADTYALCSNPSHMVYFSNCANFVSQCLKAGGVQMFHTQIGVGNRLDGGRRRVKKYLWSFLRTAPAGAGQAVTCSTSGMGLRLK